MSTRTARDDRRDVTASDAGLRSLLSDRLLGPRGLALLASLALVFAFAFPLYEIMDAVGGRDSFVLVVALSLLVATGLSRIVSARIAVVVGLGVLAVGLWTYASALPTDVAESQGRVLKDVVALLSGLSILRLQVIDVWVLAVAPAPLFLTWFLALRERYVGSVAAGGATLSFLVLTGDVSTTIALFGALGAAGTVGFGRLARHDGDVASADVLAVVLAVMIVVTTTVSVVPGAPGTAVGLLGGKGPTTVEGSLIDADQRIAIQGSIQLSPDVRFRVESESGGYWRAGAYDLYTGDGWVRTGSTTEYTGQLPGPPGRSITVRQRVQIESRLAVVPAAWRPVSVSGEDADGVRVTDLGGLQPGSPLTAGDSYTVVSQRPTTREAVLERAGDDYPDRIEDRYTKLPASTADRVEERTEAIAERANANSPYEVAEAVERWLEANKDYSLDVERPEGNVAESFLFEMDAGYCTYFATTMTAMLRSEEIPARFVVGYARGERVGEDEWVVRGLDSHAWVEVYVPDAGWVRFDPTPAGARSDAERNALDGAGGGGGVDDPDDPTPIDTPDPGPDDTPTPPPTPGITLPDPGNATTGGPGPGDTATPTATTRRNAGGGIPLPDPPSREELALGVVLLVGLAAGLRRSGLASRAYRALWLRWQPRADPERDVERAFERLEYVLAREHRPREPGETPRQYLAAIGGDERVRQVFEHYERTRYAGAVSGAAADEAVALVDRIVSDRLGPSARLPGVGR